MRIGCLHTAAGNVAVLERAAMLFDGVSLRHAVRADLLAAAGAAGGLTPAIASETLVALDKLADCDAVLLTCSSLGAVIDDIGAEASKPMLRIDRALAEAAVARGGKVVVLCTAPTTLEPTGRLFRSAAERTGAVVDLRPVPGAWAHFNAGDAGGYQAAIADIVAGVLAEGGSTVALAQVSMADAVERHPRVMTSPTIGLAAAISSAAASTR